MNLKTIFHSEVLLAFLDFIGRLRNPVLLAVFVGFTSGSLGITDSESEGVVVPVLFFGLAASLILFGWLSLRIFQKYLRRTIISKDDVSQPFRIKVYILGYMFILLLFLSYIGKVCFWISAVFSLLFCLLARLKNDFMFTVAEVVSFVAFFVLITMSSSTSLHITMLGFLVYRMFFRVAWSLSVARVNKLGNR